MITLHDFNHLPHEKALALIHPCVALPEWADALALGRPYASRDELFSTAKALTQAWGEAARAQALSAHPRIGEKPAGSAAEAALARQEQSSVDSENERLAQALREGNARYEARFGRVFLIRAKGRSGDEMLQALTHRLQHTADEEVAEALAQLREITMLRLEGVIGE